MAAISLFVCIVSILIFTFFLEAKAGGRCSCALRSRTENSEQVFYCVLEEECEDDCVCPIPNCRLNVRQDPEFGPFYSCRPRFYHDCIEPGANGEPHFVGYDGSLFDFHGENNHHYLLYSHSFGDMLVAKMHSIDEMTKNGVNKTYFSEFGVSIGGSNDFVHFSLHETDRLFSLKVTVNGKQQTKDVALNSSTLTVSSTGNDASLVTSTMDLRVHGKPAHKAFRNHLDFNLKVLQEAKLQGKFTGVLGMTMSRKLGSDIHEDVLTGNNKWRILESTFRSMYEIQGFSPSKDRIESLEKNL